MEQTIGNLIFHFDLDARGRYATIYKVESVDGSPILSVVFPDSVKADGHRYDVTSIKGRIDTIHYTEEDQYVVNDKRRKTYGQTITRTYYKSSSSCYSVMGNGENDGSLSSVRLPRYLKRIEEAAFYKCPLTSIEIPERVEYIGYSAFLGNHFRKVVIPKSVKEICTYAFNTDESSVVLNIQNMEGNVKIGAWIVFRGEVRYKGLRSFVKNLFGK